MPDSLAPFIAIPAFFIVFPLFWSGVCFLIALIGGWRGMASRYRYVGSSLPVMQHCSARIGVSNYRGVLKVGADANGLYLAVMVLFRPGHPTLFIPWSAIAAIERTTALFGYDVTKVSVAGGPTIALVGDWTALEHARR